MRKTHSLLRFLALRSWWLKPLAALVAVSFVAVTTHAQTTLGTQTLTLIAEPDGLLYSLPSSITLSKAGTNFNHEAATVTIQYRARTTATSGTGSITVEATSDFVCVGGGSCSAAPSASSGALVYTCTGATLGSGCARNTNNQHGRCNERRQCDSGGILHGRGKPLHNGRSQHSDDEF